MKTTILIILAYLCSLHTVEAQTNRSIGFGYFGEMATYPGIVANLSFEREESDKYSVLLRINMGAYTHARNHDALFADANLVFRRYTKSRMFLEHSIGIGGMLTRYNADGLFQVDDFGNVRRISSFANPDLMPSISFGIGKKVGADKTNELWIRPKVFWQFPYNNLALPHFALQAGYNISLKSK